MRGVEFISAIPGRIARIIGITDCILGLGAFHDRFDHLRGQQRALLVFHRQTDAFGNFTVQLLFQSGLLDQLIQQRLEQNIIRQALVLRLQLGARDDHVTYRDLFAVYLCDDGLCVLIGICGDREAKNCGGHDALQKSETFAHGNYPILVPRRVAALTLIFLPLTSP